MYNLKHFLDNLVVTLCYITLIVCPIFVVLNILGVCAFNSGLFNLATIVLAIIMFFVSKSAVEDARRLHHKGQRFLW